MIDVQGMHMTAGELIDPLRAFDPDEIVYVRNPCPMGDTSYDPVILVERCDLEHVTLRSGAL